MKITSPAFQDNTDLPKKYTCDGYGVTPPLIFSEIPENSKSLVLIMEDPDAPSGTFVHWVLYNIEPENIELKENSLPEESSNGKTSLGKPGYVPPCPPAGIHRYIFKLYALDISAFDIQGIPDKEEIEKLMENHIIAKNELIGLYGRK